jgi:predicted nuclease with TOPRIM domain
MANERMTVAILAKELRGLSKRVEEGFAQVDERFAKVDARFERLEARFDGLEARFDGLEARFDGLEARFDGLEARFDGLEARFDGLEARFDDLVSGIDAKLDGFATRIEQRFHVLMEGVQTDFKGTSDLARATDERLLRHEHENAEEHRLMQAQIDDLDSRLPPRRGRRRPS